MRQTGAKVGQGEHQVLWWRSQYDYFDGTKHVRLHLFELNQGIMADASSGALSVGAHLLWSRTSPSYVSDNLFHQAISISGGPIWYFSTPTLATHILDFHRLLKATDCSDLQCLRHLPLSQLQSAFPYLSNQTATPIPLIDDSIYIDFPSQLLATGAFKSVPIIFGDTTDEGTFITPRSVNTDHDFKNYIAWDHNADHCPHTLSRISKAYPNRPTDQPPGTCDSNTTEIGNQYNRLATYITDRSWVMPRRAAARAFLKVGAPVWSYRFDVVPEGTESSRGVYHGADVPFFLYQTDQLRNENHKKVARDMVERFAAFVVKGNPNGKSW